MNVLRWIDRTAYAVRAVALVPLRMALAVAVTIGDAALDSREPVDVLLWRDGDAYSPVLPQQADHR